MHGLSPMFFRGRERTSAMIAAFICFFLAALSPQPLRTIENGREVAHPVVFGHVLPEWAFFAIFLPTFGMLWFGIHRLLNRFWPEKGETVTVDKVYERPSGGFVAWKGDDPEAGSPFDYVAPQLRTALDYLQAEEPAPMRILILGPEGAEAECDEFRAELARWRRDASDSTLQNLVPAVRTLGSTFTIDLVWRLIDVTEERGIPSLDELEALADELKNDDLKEYVAEKRAEGPPSP